MTWNLVGLAAFFTGYVITRFIMTEAAKKLDDVVKLKLFDAFSNKNNYATILLIVLILLYFGAVELLPNFVFYITAIYLSIFALYLIFRFITTYQKFKAIKMPLEYIRSYKLSQLIFAIGFIIFVFCSIKTWGY